MTDRPLKILAIHANSGSRFYRVIPQLKFMKEAGHQVRLEKHDAPHLGQVLEWADVIVLQMVLDRDLARTARARGKLVLFECDDLMHKTHAKHYSYEETKGFKNQARWLWNIWRMLRACDGLIVSNEELKRAYGWMARRTLVFPNYLDLPHWLKRQRTNPGGRIRLLWAGSTSHTGDLEWITPVLDTILEKYPHVQFLYIGTGGVGSEDLYARFVYGEDVFKTLPPDQRESLLAVPPNVWPYVLAGIGADIAIAPLERNAFNRYKTQCKYLEYAVNGIPGVYSKWFYTDVKDYRKIWFRYAHGEYTPLPRKHDLAETTGFVADTPEEWIAAISLFIEDATLRAKIGEEARRVAIRDYDFRTHAPRWQGFVESLAWRFLPSPSSPSATALGGRPASTSPTTPTRKSSRT